MHAFIIIFGLCLGTGAWIKAHGQAAANEWLPEKKLSASESPYYGRRLEPKGRQILHGAGQSRRDFRVYHDTMAGQRPVLYMSYNHPKGRRSLGKLKRELESYSGTYLIPQIGVSLEKDSAYLESEEFAGILDNFCKSLADLGRPVFLRPGYEFNGEWNGYEPEQFKRAWRKLAQALRKQGLDSTALVWCYAPEGARKDYLSWYPGDEFVDWWGIDLFSPEQFNAGDTRDFMREASRRRFPVMIGESTPRWVTGVRGEISWRAWYRQYFRFMANNPHVKAFSYIAYDWAQHFSETSSLHDWGDARLWRDSLVFSRWKQSLANPVFLHGDSPEKVRKALGLPVTKNLSVEP